MSEKTDNFIQTVGVLARNEYLSRTKWVLPSVCIAQAALESGWNLQAKTLFGIKATGNEDAYKARTSEYYDGHYVDVVSAFRKYPTIAAAVKGYYDLITGLPRYAGAVNNTNYKDAITKIREGGYATSPTYVESILSIIEGYGLTAYDNQDVAATSYTVQAGDTLWSIAQKMLGDWSKVQDLASLNGITLPVLQQGQILKLRKEEVATPKTSVSQTNDCTYIVKAGDTLSGIAKILLGNGNRYPELAAFNHIANPNMIYPGQIVHYQYVSATNKIQAAIDWALSIARDGTHGYDQKYRWGPDYDCSSFVITAFEQAGIPVKSNGATYTGNMRNVFMNTGFIDVITKINLITGAGLQAGDVLLNQKIHTALYLGDGMVVQASINEKGTIVGGMKGDQTGYEIAVGKYYNKPWDTVLRYVG